MSRGTQCRHPRAKPALECFNRGRGSIFNAVIPAKAGIHFELTVATWIPACMVWRGESC